jgi:hypothetical protein
VQIDANVCVTPPPWDAAPKDMCPPEHCSTLVHIDADACVMSPVWDAALKDLCPPEHCSTLVQIDADACVTLLICDVPLKDLCPPEHCSTLVHIDADACVTSLLCGAAPVAVTRALAWAHAANANTAQHATARTFNLTCFIQPPYWLLGVIAQANLAVKRWIPAPSVQFERLHPGTSDMERVNVPAEVIKTFFSWHSLADSLGGVPAAMPRR